MRFYIKVIKKRRRDSIGEIKIGDFKETFDMATDYWSILDYERQWTDGLRRLTKGKDSSLITSITDPSSANYIVWWPMYVQGTDVLVHNQLLLLDQLEESFRLDYPYLHLPAYSKRNEDGDEISEWRTSLSEIEFFLSSQGRSDSLRLER